MSQFETILTQDQLRYETGYLESSRKTNLRNYYIENGLIPTPGVSLCDPGTVLTVVVTAYNEQNFIGRTLESLGQSQLPIEIVVVDNGSTDNTVKEVKGAACKMRYPVFLLDYPIKKGPVHGRKRGMDEVVVQYAHLSDTNNPRLIAVTDADTWVPPNWAEGIVETFARTQVGVLGGTYHYPPELDELIEDKTGLRDFFGFSSKVINFLIFHKAAQIQTYGSNMAIEIEPYVKVGGSRQPRNEKGELVKGSDVRFGEEARKLDISIGLIPIPAVTSARRAISSLYKRTSQADISTMSGWIDCRENDQALLERIIGSISKEELLRHQKERINAYVYSSIALPILKGELDLEGFIKVFKEGHSLVSKLINLKEISLNESGLTKNLAREFAGQDGMRLFKEAERLMQNEQTW